MPTLISDKQSDRLISQLTEDAAALGFSLCRITNAIGEPIWAERLREAVEQNRHGTMTWLEETIDRRAAPQSMWSEAQSAIMLAMNYGPDHNPLDDLAYKDNGVISVYARNRDYHDIIKGKLKTLAAKFLSHVRQAKMQGEVKVFVDTAPLLEKPLAERAGLGWQGKHTNLVSRELGSWFFIGSILTDIKLPEAKEEIDHCGTCQACLDICPTSAFPAPYKLDARRCISYLTIEHDGPIETELRSLMGNRIYGCDDCLAVCPWNKFAEQSSEIKLQARGDLQSPRLDELCKLDDSSFRSLFSGSPIKRIGRDRFIRNVLIAMGNSSNAGFMPHIEKLLRDASPQVRGAAVWALSQLLEAKKLVAISYNHLAQEMDESVKQEWKSALEEASK